MNHRIRLIGKSIPVSQFGDPYLWFESLSGHEAINELFEYQLIVKTKHPDGSGAHSLAGQQGYVSKSMSEAGDSPASHLNLQKLIGTNLGIDISLADKKLNLLDKLLPELNNTEIDISGNHIKNGIISSIKQLTTQNLHAVYQITLVPWVWLLTKQSGYRIYQNQSIPHILDDVLTHYPYPVEFRLSNHYPVLDYQTQYGETDYDFITRLMGEHGINYYFEHTQDQHTLILTDQNSHYQPQPNPHYQNLIIYPPNQRMPNYAEYIEHFHPAQALVTGQSLLADYQFKTPKLTLTAHDQYQWDNVHNDLQHYEWQQGMGVDNEALQTKANNRTQADYQHGHRAIGQGRLKAINVGHTFTLSNHPDSDSNIEWLVIGIQTTIQNLDPDNRTHQYYTADTQFLVQPKAIELKPEVPTQKPIARVQTATVVAPDGEEIHTDEYGRIKVKFHWDKPSLQDRRLFEPLEVKDINTCWLRVSTAWAGENYGAIQLPRAGQEVIVDFFGGDPNMPFVSGRLTNPDNMPVWQLPNEKVLSGLKSKEYQGSQSNQLVMDDTTGKLQVQLKSDHQSSELNLGSITRINPVQGRADFRGEGFELRTDGHGVVRADKGIILTSYGKQNAQSYVKDIAQTTSQLQQASEQHKSLLQVAIDQKCEERKIDATVSDELAEQVDAVKGVAGKGSSKGNSNASGSSNHNSGKSNNNASEGKYNRFPELANAQIVISSPAGIALTAKQSIHLTSSEHIALTSQKQISVASEDRFIASVAKGIRAFSQKEGIKLYAGKDDVELQAQDGKLEAIARHDVQVISTEGGIEVVSPNVVSIKVGGTELKITPEGVFITTPGIFKVKASEHVFEGGDSTPFKNLQLPKLENIGYSLRFAPYGSDENFELLDWLGEPFKLINANTNQVLSSGVINKTKLPRLFSDNPMDVKIVIGNDEWQKDILSLENNTEEGIGIEDDLEFIQEDYIDSLASENEEKLYPKFLSDSNDELWLDSEVITNLLNEFVVKNSSNLH